MIRETKFKNVFNFSIVDILKFTGPLNAFLLLFVLIFWIASFYEQSNFTSKFYEYKDNFDKYFENEVEDLNEGYDKNFFTPEEDLFEGNNVNEKIIVDFYNDPDNELDEDNENNDNSQNNQVSIYIEPTYQDKITNALAIIKNSFFDTDAVDTFKVYSPTKLIVQNGVGSRQKKRILYKNIIQPEINCKISREDAILFVKDRSFDKQWNKFNDINFISSLSEFNINDSYEFLKYKKCVSTIYQDHFDQGKSDLYFPQLRAFFNTNLAKVCNLVVKQNNITEECEWKRFSLD
ncbi:MAG: hypothetical protein GY932_10135 [Arcobacter sp.]|nr:hypothetical protein [Flavobacteriaceae bacterium]MCP4970939.1 hypothetical protein [Arcobacter sp.]